MTDFSKRTIKIKSLLIRAQKIIFSQSLHSIYLYLSELFYLFSRLFKQNLKWCFPNKIFTIWILHYFITLYGWWLTHFDFLSKIRMDGNLFLIGRNWSNTTLYLKDYTIPCIIIQNLESLNSFFFYLWVLKV